MRVNAENCVKLNDDNAKAWLAGELVRNLRELFDRLDAGDAAGIDEFRELFCFEKKE
jgi:hypothetical protein